MKKILALLGFLLLAAVSYGQTTTVTGTVVDTDGTTWANGSWKVTFVPSPSQPNPNIYNINGVPLSASVMNQSGFLDGTGAFSFSVYQNAPITPVGSTWTVTICPNAITACGMYNFTAAGTSMNLSTPITGVIPVPRFHPVSGSYGYTDAEAVLQLGPGSTYWNVASGCQRYYNATTATWSCPSGGGGGGVTPSAPAYSVQVANGAVTDLTSDPNITEDLATHTLLIGGLITGNAVYVITNPPIPASWVWDWTSPASALASLGDIPDAQILGPTGTTDCVQWDGIGRFTHSPCGSGTVSSIAVTVPSTMTITGSPITGSGTFAFGMNTTGNGTKVVTGAGTYTNNHILVADANGNAIDSGVTVTPSTTTDYYWTVSNACSTGPGQPVQCAADQTTTLPGNMPDANYQVFCQADVYSYIGAMPNYVCNLKNNVGTTPLPVTAGGTLTYNITQVMQNGGSGGSVTLYFHAHHN